MQATIHQMNEVLSGWKRLFDPRDTLALHFTRTPEHKICLNGTTEFPVQKALLSGAHISISRIRFYFTDGKQIVLVIRWPEDQGPCLDSTLYIRRQLPIHPVYGPHRWTKPMWILAPRKVAPL